LLQLAPLYGYGNKSAGELEGVNTALQGFEGTLAKKGTKYAAGSKQSFTINATLTTFHALLDRHMLSFLKDEITIADCALAASVIGSECDKNFNLKLYPKVQQWYSEFKKTEMWETAGKDLLEGLRNVKPY